MKNVMTYTILTHIAMNDEELKEYFEDNEADYYINLNKE